MLFTKVCNKCKERLPFDNFHADSRTADGLQRWCKTCRKEWRNSQPYQQQEAQRERNRTHRVRRETSRVATCPKCEQVYVGVRCKPCAALAMREWNEKNRDRIRGQRALKYQQEYKHDPAFLSAQRIRHTRYIKRLRDEVFGHYGSKCFCCGLDDVRFLTIDHSNNDGTKYRHPGGKRIAGTSQLKLIKEMGFPSDIRLACWNCNCARQYNNGICPHEIDRQQSAA